MRYIPRSSIARYGTAVLCVAVAAVLTYAVPPLREQSSTALFFAAVLLTTWQAGPGPGLLATGLSAIAIDYLFLTPLYSAFSSWDDLVRMLVFIGVSALIALLDAKRRVAETGMRRSESRLRRLSESRLLGVHIATRSGRLVEANDAFLEMIGYSQEDLRAGAVDLAAISPAQYLDLDARSFLETEARGVCAPYEKAYVRKDGGSVPVLTGSARLDDAPDEIIWLTLDLSATKRAERALRETEERFYQAQKLDAVGKLAGGVAHNFNNLLTVIISRCELLRRRAERAPELRLDVEAIHTAASRATGLTRQLLAFTRGQVLEPVPLDLDETVSELWRLLEPVIGDDVTILTLPSGRLGRVLADAGQIQQAIMNLVLNARDAMPDGGTITIETTNVDLVDGPHVAVSVTDTGRGMDDATRAHLFEPFFTTKEVGKGTGLGLSTAYGIVKQSGGTIDVTSEPGAGSTFTIYLPRVPEEVGPHTPSVAMAPLQGSETLLVVEDEPALLQVVGETLREGGYTVLEAANGAEALTMCWEYDGQIDLVLTDVAMPGLSGSDLAQQVASVRPSVRLLLMSGYSAGNGSSGALSLASPFIAKPFTPAALARKIREILDARR